METNTSYSILFIGNSYVFWHNLPHLLQKVALSQQIIIKVDSVTSGAANLLEFCDEQNELGKQVTQKLKDNYYDFVIVQEQSLRPIIDHERFMKGLLLLKRKIEATHSKIILYQTWARHPQSIDLITYHITYQDMVNKLNIIFKKIQEQYQIPVSFVGNAFAIMTKFYPNINLYDNDGSHPSLLGHYLAAIIHFCFIFQKQPLNLQTLNIEHEEKFKQIANIVLNRCL